MKHLIIALMLMASALSGSAQLRYGIRLGGLFAKPSTANASVSTTHGSGFSGGLMLEYQFEHNGFAPDIALLYTRYSNQLLPTAAPPTPTNLPVMQNAAGPTGRSATGALLYQSPGKNFLELPIHLKYKFWLSSTKKLVAPMIYTGPSLMFALDKASSALPVASPVASPTNPVSPSSASASQANPVSATPAGVASVSPGIKRFDAGWDVGIGIDIINFIQLQAGYRFGLTNALSTSPIDAATIPTPAPKLRLNGWTLAANIIFDF